MKKIIIGVHGLGNKPDESLLELWWLKSIHEGLDSIGKSRINIPFKMVYWADILHETPLSLEVEDPENPLFLEEPYVKGELTIRKEDASFVSKILNYIEEQLDKIFLNEDFSINFKNVTDKLIHHYFTELETYYGEGCSSNGDQDCSSKEKIQNRLSSLLGEYKDYEILLIPHSMGSIIAFDVLTKLTEEISINTFVTIGSPLGLPVIGARIFAEQKKINPSLKKPVVPNSVSSRWYNLSDNLDKIALDHTLNDDFNANNHGIKAKDFFVYNNYEINGKPNPHKSYGYLRTPELASIINKFLKGKRSHRIYQKYKLFVDNFYLKLNPFQKSIKRNRDESQ